MMKRFLPLMIIIVLLVTACSSSKENDGKKEDPKSNELNFKNALEKDGGISFVLSDNNNEITEDSLVQSIVERKDGKEIVYKSSFIGFEGIPLKNFEGKSDEEIIKAAKKNDKSIMEKEIKVYRDKEERRSEENGDKKYNQLLKKSAEELKYSEPTSRELNYKAIKSDLDGEKGQAFLTINFKPRTIEQVVKEEDDYPEYKILDNQDEVIYVRNPTKSLDVGKDKYIGFEGETNDDYYAVVTKAPKKTEGVTSGLKEVE